MKPAYQLFMSMLAAVFLLAGCASFEFDSGEKVAKLHKDMPYSEVVSLLGEPESTKVEQGRLKAIWSLHVAWKGMVPHNLEFNEKTRRLISWKANDEEFQNSQDQVSNLNAEPVVTPTVAVPKSQVTTIKHAQWSDALLGRELEQSSSSKNRSAKKTMFLCRNGDYKTSSANGGPSGTWLASGPASAGLLTLRGNSGSVQKYKVKASKNTLLLNGAKWMIGKDSGC